MGERFIPNPESREAHFSGLLSREDLQRELTRLDGPLTIEFPRYGEHKDVYTAPTSETPRVLSEAEYKDYREDVEQDVKGLQHRLQRLKVRLLSRSLAGSQYRERSDFRSRQEDPFFDVVMTFPSSVKHGDREEYATNEKQPAFSEFNTYVPERYRLHVTQDMSRKELVEIHNLAFAMSVMRPPTPRLKEQLERCLDEIVSLETQMHETTQQGELFAASQASGVSELTYRNVWKTYRELLKEVATLEESGSWISPTYYHPDQTGQRGSHQSSESMWDDYQRFKMPEMEEVEKMLAADYALPSMDHYPEPKSYLFNSGLAAMHAVIESVKFRSVHKTETPTYLKDAGIYFESHGLLSEQLGQKHIKEVPNQDADAWLNQILEDLPAAIFIDPLSIGPEMRVNPLTELLQKWSELPSKQHEEIRRRLNERYGKSTNIGLVIDNTTLGPLASWKEFVPHLPMYVDIYVVDSLLKYAQDGQEMTQAGLVTTYNRARENSSGYLWHAQSREGGRPTENVARRLKGILPNEDLTRKLERHSRNATFLAEELQRHIQPGGYLREVVYPGLASHPDYERMKQEGTAASGLLHIRVPENLIDYDPQDNRHLRSHDGPRLARLAARKFEETILTLAANAGIELNMGTSYGFATTRMAVYNHSRERLPYLRIAVGTENQKDILLIAEMIKRVDDLFSQAYRDGSFMRLPEGEWKTLPQ